MRASAVASSVCAGMCGKARRHRHDDPAHAGQRRDQQHELRRHLPGEHAVGEMRRGVVVPCCACSAAKRGRKAALNAPSPKMARKLLGRRNATRNASDNGPAPRIARHQDVAREIR